MRAASWLLMTRNDSARASNASNRSLVTGVRARVSFALGFAFVGGDLILELQNLLARIRQRVSLAIERFHAMTADASTLIEKIFRQIQLIGALRYAIIRVAHLATGLGIFFLDTSGYSQYLCRP